MNLYKILGIEKDADKDSIKKAYKRVAQINHPDKGGDDVIFHDISTAYQVLSDPERKKRYDETGEIEQKDKNLAESRLILLFNGIISEGNFDGDIIKLCTDKVQTATHELNRQSAALNIKRDKLEKQLGRVESRDFNLYDQMLSSSISEIDNNIDAIQIEIDLMIEVESLLSCYKDSKPIIIPTPSMNALHDHFGTIGHGAHGFQQKSDFGQFRR